LSSLANIEISIFDDNQKLLKKFIPNDTNDLQFSVEMFTGIRSFDMTGQLEDMLEHGLNYSEQSYSLFCTYVKFGNTIQEQADFNVSLQRRAN